MSKSLPVQAPLAVVDIGSNTGRVVVLRLHDNLHVEILADAGTPLRLVRDVDEAGRLNDIALERTIAAVRDFRAVAESAGAVRIVAVATAAVRSAANGAAFVAAIAAATGVEVRIIDGAAEGRYAFLGAVHGLPVDTGLLLDIGGGSVELAHFRNRRLLQTWTLPLGALLLSGRFLVSDPPRAMEMARLVAHVATALRDAGVPPLGDGERLIGTGGSVRNVAKIDRAAQGEHLIPRLHGYVVQRTGVDAVVTRLAAITNGRRGRIPGASADRAESIVGGALVVQTVMARCGVTAMVVAGQGLREGVALAESDRPLATSGAIREASIIALTGRFSTWDEARARRRAALTSRLSARLDAACPVAAREALDIAATVVDIGRSVDFYDGWQHASRIITAADLQGFSHEDILLISGIIKSAAGDRTASRQMSKQLGDGMLAVVERCGVILALADEIERRIRRDSEDVTIAWTTEDKVLGLVVSVPAGWRPNGLLKRIRRVFDVELVLRGERGTF